MNVHFKQAANCVTWGLEAIPILHSLACLLVFEKKIVLCLEGFFSYAKCFKLVTSSSALAS